MDKLRVQVNGRGYYLRTDKPDEVLKFAKLYEEKILYIMTKMPGISEAEASALSALLIMGDSLKKERSDEDQALIDELSGKIEVLEERNGELSANLALHNETEDAMRTEMEQLRAREQTLLEQLGTATKQQEELAGTCSENETALNDTKSALASANKIIAQINTEKFTEVAANEALRNELEDTQARLEAANKSIAELNGKITKMEINAITSDDGSAVAADSAELKKLRAEKEDVEIELAIAQEEIEKLRTAGNISAETAEVAKKLAEYEKTIKQYEARSSEIDKLRSVLAETEQSVRQKVDEKEAENHKLRNILKNYESSYGVCMNKKEEEIREMQLEIEKLKEELSIKNDDSIGGAYVQTTFES